MTPDISIIIVNFNVQYFIEQCLHSIYDQSVFSGEVETIVVDNNSSDGSVAMIKQSFPQVILIENRENVGFSVANNQGIRVSTGKYTLLLNPDTLLSEDTLGVCFSKMEADPSIGAIGVRMVDGAGSFLPESKRGFPTPAASFYRFSGMHKLFPTSKTVNAYYQGHIEENETAEIEILCGAFMFMRHSILQKVGFLDEDFFMYGEDIDLSYRIKKAGAKILYLPETSIVHFKGESTRKDSVQYTSRFYKAMDIFARKHFQGSKASSFMKYLSIVIWIKAGLNYVTGILRNLWLPILDIMLLLIGLKTISILWAKYYFDDVGYYNEAPLTLNFIVYTLIWLIFIFFGGGYDKKLEIPKVLRNIAIGSIVILAIYGLLSTPFRSSRAIIILTSGYALIMIPIIRLLMAKFFELQISGFSKGKRLVILAQEQDALKIEGVLRASNIKFQSIERLPVDISAYELGEIIKIRGIDEVISNVKDVGMSRVILLMSELGSLASFKITGDESLGIIGSHSKNKSGEIYTLEINYAIQSERNKRNKRAVDIFVAAISIILFPISIMLPLGRKIIREIPRLIVKKKTVVGYSGERELPILPPPIVVVPDGESTAYAKEYTAWKDFRYLWTSLIKTT